MSTPATPQEIEVVLANGVKGTVAIPHSVDADNPYEAGYAPATHKMALLLHGQGGHRNYCYQKALAHRLAADLGIYSLRIDFRGCGDSPDNADPVKGRLLSQDIEDIQLAAEFINNNPLKMNFVLSAVVSHSRGSVAAFLWALKQEELLAQGKPAIIVPNLVNCSSRYLLHTVSERFGELDNEDFEGGLMRVLRFGKMQNILIPRAELKDLSLPDLSKLKNLSLDTSVLSIYGLEDNVIHVTDSAHFANVLNRGQGSHQLELIPGADHNFYGVHPIETEDDAETYNPHGYPLNSKKFVNYNFLVVSYIVDYLKPENELARFAAHAQTMGRISRWKAVEGVSNFRDMGGWRVFRPTFLLPELATDAKYYVKPELLYRCANTANITPNGLKTLEDLKIKVMFDLRSDGECVTDGIPAEVEKYGVKRIHAPVFSKDDYSPQAIAMRYTNLMTSWYTYVHVYENMLEFGVHAFKTVFEYIRDDGRPFVFHCTAGKDRTGILGMLILLLIGVDNHTIAKEYELTTTGLKPDHPKLKASFQKTIEKVKEKFGDKSSDVEALIVQGRQNWTIEEQGFENLISSRYEAMLATIELFKEKYGGIIPYLKDQLGFSDSDIGKIYRNLVAINTPNQFGYHTLSTVDWNHNDNTRAKF